MSALVLKQLSAFELEAWLGVTLSASYVTDIFFGVDMRVLKLFCIAATVVGLVLIARSGKEGILSMSSEQCALSAFAIVLYQLFYLRARSAHKLCKAIDAVKFLCVALN